MATIGDVQQHVADVAQIQADTSAVLASLDLKIDEIRAFIASLQVGVPVTQQQLDDLFTALDGIKNVALTNKQSAEAALAETDALDAA